MQFVPLYFFIALFIGFFYIYITTDAPKVILKNPTPDNIDNITYIDDNNVCYKYKKDEIKCPLANVSDVSNISDISDNNTNNDNNDNINVINY